MRRTNRTQPLDALASRVLGRADKHGKRHSAAAINAWNEVVGNDIAVHTKGFALREDREMVVFVDSAAWANQLALMADDLQERLNERLGQGSVRSLRFTVSRKVKEGMQAAIDEQLTDEFYQPDPVDPLPLDDVELAQAASVASAVKDDALREAALRVMVRDLERKKGARRKSHPEAPTDAS